MSRLAQRLSVQWRRCAFCRWGSRGLYAGAAASLWIWSGWHGRRHNAPAIEIWCKCGHKDIHHDMDDRDFMGCRWEGMDPQSDWYRKHGKGTHICHCDGFEPRSEEDRKLYKEWYLEEREPISEEELLETLGGALPGSSLTSQMCMLEFHDLCVAKKKVLPCDCDCHPWNMNAMADKRSPHDRYMSLGESEQQTIRTLCRLQGGHYIEYEEWGGICDNCGFLDDGADKLLRAHGFTYMKTAGWAVDGSGYYRQYDYHTINIFDADGADPPAGVWEPCTVERVWEEGVTWARYEFDSVKAAVEYLERWDKTGIWTKKPFVESDDSPSEHDARSRRDKYEEDDRKKGEVWFPTRICPKCNIRKVNPGKTWCYPCYRAIFGRGRFAWLSGGVTYPGKKFKVTADMAAAFKIRRNARSLPRYVAARYTSGLDTIRIPGDEMTDQLIQHELVHRYWDHAFTREDKRRWKAVLNKYPTVRDDLWRKYLGASGKGGPVDPEEILADLISQYDTRGRFTDRIPEEMAAEVRRLTKIEVGPDPVSYYGR